MRADADSMVAADTKATVTCNWTYILSLYMCPLKNYEAVVSGLMLFIIGRGRG